MGIKSKRMKSAGQVACTEKIKDAYKILGVKPEKEGLLGALCTGLKGKVIPGSYMSTTPCR
jgi:hypothetical protein